ncbi:MAG TPA: GYD domain-containing protein [Methanoregulaceae archaeon]|nr:GYD domain-containing protein [Methanoregulaceae archaeon]
MMTFIIFGHFTQQGVEKVRNVTENILELKVLIQAVGGKVADIYYTLGAYDFVAFIDAPDEKSMLKAMMEIAQLGTLRTETLVAVTAKEVAELIKQ